MKRYLIITVIFFIIHLLFSVSSSQNNQLARIVLNEIDGLARETEYIEFPLIPN